MELKSLRRYREVIRISEFNLLNPELTPERRIDLLIFYGSLAALETMFLLGVRPLPVYI